MAEGTEPTKEQKQWFWEQYGFTKTGELWRYPVPYDSEWHYEPPPIDLNNLFKYPVPKLMSLGWKRYCEIMMKWAEDFILNNKDPALTLFWVLEVNGDKKR